MKVCELLTNRLMPPQRKSAISLTCAKISPSTPKPEISRSKRQDSKPSGSLPYMLKKAPVIVRQVAKHAFVDQLLGVHHQRRPAIIEADEAQDARLARDPLDLRGLQWRPADRLLTEDVLAGRCCRFYDLQVQIVRRGDVDDVHIGMRDDISPVRRCAFEAVSFPRALRPG